MSRILHIIGDSKYGGASVLIQRLAIEGKNAGHKVGVLATDFVFQRHLRDLGIEVVDLQCIWRDIRPVRDVLGLIRLVSYLSKSEWDIIHTHTSKAGVIGRLSASIARIRLIIHTTHGFAFHEKSPRWHILLGAIAEKLAAQFCHKIVYVCHFDCDWARHLGIGTPEKRTVIPNGIPPLSATTASRPVNPACQPINSSKPIRCLNVARLVPIKGHKTLIDAASLLRNKSLPICYEIVGDGPSRAAITAEVKRQGLDEVILILGFRADIAALMKDADIIVQPSIREGLSIVLLEAMRMGKPIIAAAIGSTLEASNYGQSVELFEAGNSKALAAAIHELATNEEKRIELGKRAVKRFQSHYTEERMISDYLKLYKSIES